MFFIIKIAIGLVVFNRIKYTNYFIFFNYLKNSKEDAVTRMWQLPT